MEPVKKKHFDIKELEINENQSAFPSLKPHFPNFISDCIFHSETDEFDFEHFGSP